MVYEVIAVCHDSVLWGPLVVTHYTYPPVLSCLVCFDRSYNKDPNTNRLQAAFWATSRMQELAHADVRFMSFDTTHCLNWQDMYTGMDGWCPPLCLPPP